jgi:hypothetical protein
MSSAATAVTTRFTGSGEQTSSSAAPAASPSSGETGKTGSWFETGSAIAFAAAPETIARVPTAGASTKSAQSRARCKTLRRRQGQSTSRRAKTDGQQEDERVGVLARLGQSATLIGVLVAAFLSGANLIFEVWPHLRPDPKARVGAELAVLELEENVTRRNSRDRRGDGGIVASNPADQGNLFYLRARIEGFKRESLQMKWFTYNSNGRRRPGPRSSASEEEIFEPEAPINTQIAQVWVKAPQVAGRYYVRFELYSGEVLLALVDSARFSIEEL